MALATGEMGGGGGGGAEGYLPVTYEYFFVPFIISVIKQRPHPSPPPKILPTVLWQRDVWRV